MNRRRKQIAATLLAGTLVVTSGIFSTQTVKAEEVSSDVSYDYVYFGHYLQEDTNGDGIVDDNDEKQSIKWRILSQNGDDAYVLSEYILDFLKYNATLTDVVTWETCTLRNWLNNDFYNTAFTTAEQGAIIEQNLVNEDNPWYGTSGGNNTTDKVYLPSIADMGNPAYGFSADYSAFNPARKGIATAYAKQIDACNSWTGGYWWWLRSPGDHAYCASFVNGFGDLRGDGLDVDGCYEGVRPALHLNLSSPLVTKESVSPVDEEETTKDVADVFNDVKSTDWFHDAVQYAYDNNIMSGKGNRFDPAGNITREEFVQVLYSCSGKPEVTGTSKTFPDVQKKAWYENAVLWASANNIANGNGDGTFGVGAKISRQDLALMLYKYAGSNGYDLTAEANLTEQFQDASKVSTYAKNALDWAVTQGIISGKGKSGAPRAELRLDPQGSATRAECAAMMRMLLTNNE